MPFIDSSITIENRKFAVPGHIRTEIFRLLEGYHGEPIAVAEKASPANVVEKEKPQATFEVKGHGGKSKRKK